MQQKMRQVTKLTRATKYRENPQSGLLLKGESDKFVNQTAYGRKIDFERKDAAGPRALRNNEPDVFTLAIPYLQLVAWYNALRDFDLMPSTLPSARFFDF